MVPTRESIERFIRNEEGLAVTEYGLLLALVGVLVAAAVVIAGPKIVAVFQGGADGLAAGVQ
jgi:pilus assembly protein Flp/PilA